MAISVSFKIFRIKLDAVFFEKESQFLGECHLAVMFFLRFDITPDIVPPACADGECRVTLLPGKSRAMIASSPHRGSLFQFAQEILDCVICVEADEKMDMVIHAPDGSSLAAQPLDGSAKVCVERPAPAGMDEGLAVLCAENEVVMERKVCGAHRKARL